MASPAMFRRFLYALAGVAVVFAGAYFLMTAGNWPEGGVPVTLYYYNPSLDQGPGGIACSEQGLVPVERVIPRSKNPVRDSVKLLLDGELTNEERDRGITTEFPLDEFTLQSADVHDGVATLSFLDPQHASSGGACRVTILRMQVESTVRQFPHVRSIRILPEEIFQP